MNDHLDLKHRPKVAALRRQLAALLLDLRRDRRTPAPSTRAIVCRAFRDAIRPTPQEIESMGICQMNKPLLDIRNRKPISTRMEVEPPMAKLAAAYQTSRQNLYSTKHRHGLSVSDLAEPDRVFQALLTGRSCPLRQLLSDPTTRHAIRESLNK